MAASVQLAQSTDDHCHAGKTSMPLIKPTILYTTGRLRKDRNSNDNSETSKYGSTMDIVRGLSRDGDNFSALNDLQSYMPIMNQSRSSRRSNMLHPPSPHAGVSEECIAMANACSHDHDYSVSSFEICSPRSKSENKEIYRRHSISPGIIIKREHDDVIDVSTLGCSGEIIRTPRAPNRNRTRRIVLVRKGSIDLKNLASQQKLRNEDDNASKIEKNDKKESVTKLNEKLMIKSDDVIKSRPKNRDSSFTLHTTVDSKNNKELCSDITSPRPSITPFPPAERRGSRRGSSSLYKNANHTSDDVTNAGEIKQEPEDLEDNRSNCKISVDSAYNSLTYSSTSQPRTPSGNRPASGGKRSATCGLTSSSSSGTSSDEWSDLDSPQHNETNVETNIAEVNTENGDDESQTIEPLTKANLSFSNRHASLSPRPRKINSGKKLRKQSSSSRINSSETQQVQETKSEEKIQFVPTPPTRKPKKGKYYRSVPMRLRALPTSFWEEPNRTNASPYTILPPVHALFHQQDNEDIADIRPVTPPNERETSISRQTISAAGSYDRTRHRTIIRTGDTDLLLRLFDKVETKQNETGIRAKRGRPKRPSYSTVTTSRRANNDNPCIMNSITEKLFPKLSLDHRHTLAAMVTSSAMMSSTAFPTRPVDVNSEEPKQSHSQKFNSVPSDVTTANMLLSDDDSPGSSYNFSTDLSMEMMTSSPSPTLQPRPSPILPQLVMHKEYSQLLNELASVL